MASSNRGLWIAMCVPVALVGSVMYFKWNADGPGTHGGGDDLHVTLEAPMAAPMQPPESALLQRRHERAIISGTVRQPDNTPIAGAHVCAAASSSLLGSNQTRFPRCTRSDRDGHYQLGDLHGVRQRISASAVGHLPADHLHQLAGVPRRAIDLRPGAVASDIDITLAPGGVEIRGHVRDLHGAPIPDASVASGGADQGNGVASITTDADGSYALWVRPGVTTVTAQARGHVTASTTGPGPHHRFDLYLAPASILRGRAVRADNGDPVDGAWVRARPDGPAVKTDPAGHFVFDDLPPGIYTPRAVTDDGAGTLTSPITLGLGETSPIYDIAMNPAMFVEGRLTYPDGEACDDGSLTLHDPTRGSFRDTAEPGGMVHIRGLLPGSYEVRVACKGALAAPSYPRIIVRGRDLLQQTWPITRGYSVAGTVVDAAGRPVGGATLAATNEAERTTAVSDDAGSFVLRGLARGTHFVAVVADPQHTMPAAPVTVTVVDADITTLRLRLAATGEVRGHLHDRHRQAIAGASVSLRSPAGELHTLTGDDGGFVLASAALGPAVVSVRLADAPLPLRSPTSLVVRGDKVTTLELVATPPTGALTGLLLDPDGQPVAAALIEARPELPGADAGSSGLWRAGGEPPLLTDAAGRFTLTALIAAPYTVVARRFGGGEARQTHVRPGAALTLTLNY